MSVEEINKANNDRAHWELLRQLTSGQDYVERDIVERVRQDLIDDNKELKEQLLKISDAVIQLTARMPQTDEVKSLTELANEVKLAVG